MMSRLTTSLEGIAQSRSTYGPREDIASEGQRSRVAHLLIDGWACSYKLLDDGRRQILNILVPGDLCDFEVFDIGRMDFSIGSLTPVTIANITRDAFTALTARQPALAIVCRRRMLALSGMQRERIVSLGRRTALERLAHFICEIAARLYGVSMQGPADWTLPITQADIGDALGLSTVHVNRTVTELRRTGLITWRGKRIGITDTSGLQELARFNPVYLHLDAPEMVYATN